MTASPLDSLDARGALAAVAAAIRATVDAAGRAEVPDDVAIDGVALTGVGAHVPIAAVAALAQARTVRPVVAAPGGPTPGWVGSRSLVVDFSGGGPGDAHVVSLDPGPRPQPVVQTAVGLAVLGGFGLLGGVPDELADAADHVERTVDLGRADALARRIGRTMVLAYGGGPVGAAAALAWKWSVNRNAKSPSFAASVPGLDHDEIVGWGQHGDVTRQVFTLVVLRHSFETAEEAHRLDVTAETCEEIVGGVHEVRSAAVSPTAALFELMVAGEALSLAMAAQAGVDPGPTPVLGWYDR